MVTKEYVKLTPKEIIPYEKNARKNDAAVSSVVESIKQCDYIAPICVDENNIILAGHTRFKALKRLKFSEIDVCRVNGLTDEQKRKYRLLDNKTTELAEWDFDLLQEELTDLDFGELKLDWGIDLDETPTEIIEDEAPEIDEEIEPIAKLGDIWKLGRHRLMCGDSTDKATVERLMNGKKADMVMTDPPYGINAEKMTMGSGKKDFHRGVDWDNERPDISIVFDIAPLVCIWGGNYFADRLPITNDWLIWHKKNDGLSFSECELAWTNFEINCRHISHHWGNEKKQHVTMKPLSVISWAIERAKTKANVIVDLFGGSGTTLIACEQLNRTCFTMELDPKYCDVIIKRWETLTGEKAVLLSE